MTLKRTSSGRAGISGVVGALILFVMIFTVGTGYFLWVNTNNATYAAAFAQRNAANIAQQSESVNLTATTPAGVLTLTAQDTGTLPINMTNVFVLGSTGNVMCTDSLKQGGIPCPPTTQIKPIGVVIDPANNVPTTVDTGCSPTSIGCQTAPGSTYTIKVVTQRGNTFSATYQGIGVTTTLSSSSIGAGSSVTDTAFITGGSNPTGTVDFFFSTSSTCPDTSGSPTQVGGAVPVVGGMATSTSQSFPTTGTYYWYAEYIGDNNNAGGEYSPCEQLTVNAAQPTLITSTTPPVMNIGSSVSDTAYISGGSPSLAGNVNFALYGTSTCTGVPFFTDTEPVTGNGAVTSKSYTPPSTGTYYWEASFTATDSNDNSIPAYTCPVNGEIVKVNSAQSSITTLLSDTTIVAGGSVYDTATLSSVTANAGGMVQYYYYANGSCSPVGHGNLVGPQQAVNNGVVPPSPSQTFSNSGPFSWDAMYLGDGNNLPATSPCEPLTVQNAPVITTSLTSPSIPLGGAVSDTAVLTGATSGAGGSISFWWSLVNACPTSGATLFSTVNPVSGDGTYPSVPSQPLSTPGIYFVYATYSGDAYNEGVTSPCEPLTVGLAVTTSLSATTIPTGGSVYDSATLHFATGNAGGKVAYSWFQGSSCVAPGTQVGSPVTVNNGVVPPSSQVSFTTAGSYSWDANYTGDSNNQGPVISPCEPLTVIQNSGSGSGGSLGLVSESFRFYYTNCNSEGNTGTCPPGTGDGVSAGGYYGYGLSFNPLPTCTGFFFGCFFGGSTTANPDVYQLKVTNTDPTRTITLSAQSFLFIQGQCSVTFLCSFLSTPFAQSYWIVSTPTSTGNGAVVTPYDPNSPVTIPPSTTATIYFYCTGGPCTSAISPTPGNTENAPPAGASLVVSVGLFGIYSDGTPFAQTIPYVASYVSPVYISSVSPAQPTGAVYLSGAIGSTIQLTAANFPTSPSSVNVYWTNSDGTTSIVTVTGSSSCTYVSSTTSYTCTVSFKIPATASPGTYYGIYVTSDGVNNAYATVFVVGGTTTTVSCNSNSIGLGATTPCTATVTGSSPTGTVTWTQNGGTGGVTFSPGTCTLSAGSCTVNVKGTVVGSATVQAAYNGDVNNQGSTGTTSLSVSKSTTATSVSCAGTACTATVTGFSGTVTGETITWSQSGAGSLTLSSGTCALSAGGTCSVTAKGATAGSDTLQASYPGDANNLASSGSASLTITATTANVSCVPISFAVGSTGSCTATLTGFSGTVTGETITWTQNGGTGSVTFSSGTCTLSAAGTCSVTITGHTVGTATVQSSYAGDSSNVGATGSSSVTVKASTTTSVSCLPSSVTIGGSSSCTATVTGASGSIAGETITFSQTGGTGSVTFPSPATCNLVGTSCSVSVSGATRGSVTIQASYPGDANNGASTGTGTLTVKSTTTTGVVCSNTTCVATLTGFTGTVTGEAITWTESGSGVLSFGSGGSCALSAGGTCSVTATSTTAGPVTVTGTYGGDGNNQGSFGTAAVHAATTSVSCNPITINHGSTSSCTATISGFSGTVTGETISWSQVGGTGTVTFPSPATCNLSAAGSCSITVTGANGGSVTIQASYPGDSANSNIGSSGTTSISVKTTPTVGVSCNPSPLIVGFTSTCTVTLTGYSGSVTGETITWSQNGGSGSTTFPSGTTCNLSSGGTCNVSVKGSTAGSATIQASYPGDSNNSPNTGSLSTSVIVFGIDAGCEGFGSTAGSNTVTTASITCGANDLVIVVITGANGNSVNGITDSLGSHLTYQYQCNACDPHSSETIDEAYATTGSSSATFTIKATMSGTGAYDIYAFGVTGANLASPFDPNGALIANGHSGSAGTPSIPGISTSNAADMIIGLEGHASSTLETGASPFALIGSAHEQSGQGISAEDEIVSTTQSGITVSFGSNSGGAWSMIVDAIEADPPAPAAPLPVNQTGQLAPAVSVARMDASSNIGRLMVFALISLSYPIVEQKLSSQYITRVTASLGFKGKGVKQARTGAYRRRLDSV